MKIDKDLVNQWFFKCLKCKGVGIIEESSHDCWGKPEWRELLCYHCNGNGYTIHPVLKKSIKETLGI